MHFTECKDGNQVTPPSTNNSGTIENVSEVNNLRLTSINYDMVEDAKGDVWLLESNAVYRFSGSKIVQKFSVNNGNVNSASFCPMFAKNKDGDIYVHSQTLSLGYNELYKVSNSNLVSLMKGEEAFNGPNYLFFNKFDELEVGYVTYNLKNNTMSVPKLGFSWTAATFDGTNYWYVDSRSLYKSGVAVNPTKLYTDVRFSNGRVLAFSMNIGLDIFQSNKWLFVNSNLSQNYPMDFRPMNFSVTANGDIFLCGSKGTNGDIGCIIKIGQDLTVSQVKLNDEFQSKCYSIWKTFVDSKGFLWIIYMNKNNALFELAKLKL